MKRVLHLCIAFLAISAGTFAQDSTYKELAGKYKFPAGTVIEEAIVTVENGIVNMSSAQGVSVLERIKGDTFNVVSFNGIAVFKRGEDKKIAGVHVDASGYVMDGQKEIIQVADHLVGGTKKAPVKAEKYIYN
ncbi:MAG: hypothetical protein ABIR15_22665 [Chitinophagaceae bacterium]